MSPRKEWRREIEVEYMKNLRYVDCRLCGEEKEGEMAVFGHCGID